MDGTCMMGPRNWSSDSIRVPTATFTGRVETTSPSESLVLVRSPSLAVTS